MPHAVRARPNVWDVQLTIRQLEADLCRASPNASPRIGIVMARHKFGLIFRTRCRRTTHQTRCQHHLLRTPAVDLFAAPVGRKFAVQLFTMLLRGVPISMRRAHTMRTNSQPIFTRVNKVNSDVYSTGRCSQNAQKSLVLTHYSGNVCLPMVATRFIYRHIGGAVVDVLKTSTLLPS